MKKLKFTLATTAIMFFAFSCTPETLTSDEQLTDKEEVCPPNDRNCNGIPDNEELD